MQTYSRNEFADRQREWLLYLDSKVRPHETRAKQLQAQKGTEGKPISDEDSQNSDKRSIVVCPSVYERLRLPEAITSAKLPVNHRVILPNEIVLECDDPEVDWNRQTTAAIISKFREKNIPYVVGFTGGKSFHIHLWLDFGSIPLSNEAVIGYFDKGELHPRDFRNFYFQKELFPFCKGLQDIVGELKLDMGMFQKNHLIREFGGLHEKSGRRKTALPGPKIEVPPKDMTVIFPHELKLWKPKNLSKKFCEFIADYEDGLYRPTGQAKLAGFKQWSH